MVGRRDMDVVGAKCFIDGKVNKILLMQRKLGQDMIIPFFSPSGLRFPTQRFQEGNYDGLGL